MGLHRAFLEEQIPVDFVHTDDVINDRLSGYKIVFVPYPVMMSRALADGLTRYIRNGGTVVAEARLAWNDERGFASDVIPGFNLAEVFGAREKEIRNAEKPVMKTESVIAGLAAGTQVPTEAFEESLEPSSGTRVLARWPNGDAAATSHDLGRGKAILIGSFVALSYQRHPEQTATKQFLVGLGAGAGVTSDALVRGSTDLEVRRLRSRAGAESIFFFNHSDSAITATIDLKTSWQSSFKSKDGEISIVPIEKGVRINLNIKGRGNSIYWHYGASIDRDAEQH